MLFDLKNPKHRRVLLLIIISTIAYSLSNVVSYIVAVNIPVSMALISGRIGFFIAALCFILFGHEKIDLGLSASGLVSWVYGICFAVVGLLLFIAYQTWSLANIFPLIDGGALVFLALDLFYHRKKLGRAEIALLVIGVGVVVFGTFFAESSGFSFNIATLPYAVGIIVASGVGYYALANKTKRVTEGSKQLAFVLAGLVMGLVVLGLYHGPSVLSRYSNIFFFAGIVGGGLLGLAMTMEIRAIRHAMGGSEKRDVVFRNFLNNFTDFDTVIVLLASVAIGSFTIDGLLGGALIVVGVIVLSMVT